MRSKSAALCLLLLLFAGLITAQPPRRIQFPKGSHLAEITGTFTTKATHDLFVVHAARGQHMTVEIRPRGPVLTTAGTVTSPSGKSDGSPGGVIFDSDLTETGDYKIQVYERQQIVPGSFVLVINLK